MKNIRLIRIHQSIFLIDFVFLNLGLITAHLVIFRNTFPNLSSEAFIILANSCWILVSFLNRNYKIQNAFNANDVIEKLLMTFMYQSCLLLSAIYFFKILNISRGFVLIGLGIFFLLTFIVRVCLKWFLKSSKSSKYLRRRALIIGNKTIADSLISTFLAHPELGYETQEFIDEEQHADCIETGNLEYFRGIRPNEIFVCYKEIRIEYLDKLIQYCERSSVRISVVFDTIINDKKRKLRPDDLPILQLNNTLKDSLKIRILKRSFDILFSSVLMISGAPIFLLLYIITKITSKGKAFYKQERIGKNGEPFNIYKFRSMYTDSEKFGPMLSSDNDPRITKWGRIIRKTRLDELPQFWNVLCGDMSIVGYRPERKHFIDEISKKRPEYKNLLVYKPGITSMGQVHYGYAENVDQMCERLRYDLLYFRNINLNSDFKIILKTVKVMVQGKGK